MYTAARGFKYQILKHAVNSNYLPVAKELHKKNAMHKHRVNIFLFLIIGV